MVARNARKTHELAATAFAFVCGVYASSGSALEENGFEYIVNFDELPIGATEISYDTVGPPAFMIMGGEVMRETSVSGAFRAQRLFFGGRSDLDVVKPRPGYELARDHRQGDSDQRRRNRHFHA